MNNEPGTSEKGLDAALELARKNDIHGARIALGVSEEFTDSQLIEALIGLDKGIELFINQRHMAALEHLKEALPIVEASDDEGVKFVISTLCRFAEGLSALFSGDAHSAAELLNLSSEAIEKMSFFMPEFKVVSFSFKTASLMALARCHLNAADIPSAEKVFGDLRNVHDELLKHLDPSEDEHTLSFAEVYGTRLELTFLFIVMMDIPSLDLDMWQKRLEISRSDRDDLEKLIDKIPKGAIQIMLSQYPVIFSVLENLQNSLELAILKRRPFNKKEVKALVDVDTELFNSKQLIQKCGERGKGLLFQIDQLRRLQQNILQIGKAATKDFGRFSGLVSLASLILSIVVVHFTVKPTGYLGVLYYFGALILSLIVGFGYGALRFQPLLKIFADAMQKKPENGQ